MVRYGKRYDTFEDALSGYINQIWQDLTEEEKTNIKNILEMSLDNVDFRLLQQLLEEQKKTNELLQEISEKI